MGAGASSSNRSTRSFSTPSRTGVQATLLINGSVKRGAKDVLKRPMSNGYAGIDTAAMYKINQRRRWAEAAPDDELQTMVQDSDPATLHILHSVKEVDSLSEDKASLKLQILHECYPYLEQVPTNRMEHLAVLVHQKEGDVYFAKGDAENAKSAYGRAIQIAETRVARGEKEIYMVLKRYVLSMVGMARLWYKQESESTGFVFAAAKSPVVRSLDDSIQSVESFEGSVLSDTSVFSLNQEVLKSMAPKALRRRVGPTVNVVKLLRPKVTQAKFTAEDEFVLRSQMTRELKMSPCELILLRCIEVVEIGHRRQSELLLPALIELAQIYENLHLYNRSLLLVRRCLGILCVVYDYDHPWIVELRRRADYLVDRMGLRLREDMATKIQATWKMYVAMCQLEERLGRTVTRHVCLPHSYQNSIPESDFLKTFVSELPDGTVLCGTGHGNEILDAIEENASEMRSSVPPRVHGGMLSTQKPPLSPEVGLSHSPLLRHGTKVMHGDVPSVAETDEKYGESVPSAVYRPAQVEDQPATNTVSIPNGSVVNTVQNTQTDTQLQNTEYGGMLTIRTTTITRTVTEREVGSDEEDSDDEEHIEEHHQEEEENAGMGTIVPSEQAVNGGSATVIQKG